MTAKEYLQRYLDGYAEIEALAEELQRLKSLSAKVTVAFDADGSAAGTRSTDKLERCVEKIIQTEERIQTRITELSEVRDEINDTIMQVRDSKHKTLLIKRYILGKSFEIIATSMGYTYNHVVKNVHPEALQEVEKIIAC